MLISRPANAIDLDLSDERTWYHLEIVTILVRIALMAFARQNLSKMPLAQLFMR
jgi:hypothetical protein